MELPPTFPAARRLVPTFPPADERPDLPRPPPPLLDLPADFPADRERDEDDRAAARVVVRRLAVDDFDFDRDFALEEEPARLDVDLPRDFPDDFFFPDLPADLPPDLRDAMRFSFRLCRTTAAELKVAATRPM